MADNTSNITTAFEKVLPCSEQTEEDEDEHETDGERTLLMDDGISPIEMDEELDKVPQRRRCFAHTDQLCLAGSIGTADFKAGSLGKLITRCSKIINTLNSSTVAMPFLKKKTVLFYNNGVRQGGIPS